MFFFIYILTAKPTEISNKEKGRVKKKNAPGNNITFEMHLESVVI